MDDNGGTPDRWYEYVPWWTDVRLAFAAGMAFGYQLGRDDQDVIDDAVHRQAARTATKLAGRPRRDGKTDTEGQQAA